MLTRECDVPFVFCRLHHSCFVFIFLWENPLNDEARNKLSTGYWMTVRWMPAKGRINRLSCSVFANNKSCSGSVVRCSKRPLELNHRRATTKRVDNIYPCRRLLRKYSFSRWIVMLGAVAPPKIYLQCVEESEECSDIANRSGSRRTAKAKTRPRWGWHATQLNPKENPLIADHMHDTRCIVYDWKAKHKFWSKFNGNQRLQDMFV